MKDHLQPYPIVARSLQTFLKSIYNLGYREQVHEVTTRDLIGGYISFRENPSLYPISTYCSHLDFPASESTANLYPFKYPLTHRPNQKLRPKPGKELAPNTTHRTTNPNESIQPRRCTHSTYQFRRSTNHSARHKVPESRLTQARNAQRLDRRQRWVLVRLEEGLRLGARVREA